MNVLIRLFVFFQILFQVCYANSRRATIVIDYANGSAVVYAKNADEKRYPASLTKMMIAYLVLKAVSSKIISFDTKFKVSKLAACQAPSKVGLKIGEKVSVFVLLHSILVKSANDAAVVIAEGLYGSTKKCAEMMNREAKLIGMKGAHFENPSGLPDSRQVCTARDLAILGMKIFKTFPQYWFMFSKKCFMYLGKKFSTSCKILHWCKGVDGAKTGYIGASGFNLFVSAIRHCKDGRARRLFIVSLGHSSAKERDLYVASLVDRYMQKFNTIKHDNGAAQIDNEVSLRKKKGLLDQIPSVEEEEINIEEIMKYHSIDKKSIDELYQEEEIDIEEEFFVKKDVKKRKDKQDNVHIKAKNKHKSRKKEIHNKNN